MLELTNSQIMNLALLGGVFSLASTSLGAFLVLLKKYFQRISEKHLLQFKFSIDFALGVMLSAVAFSLFGPELISSLKNFNITQMQTVLGGFSLGVLFIGWTHKYVERKSQSEKFKFNSTHLVLALALIFHNFPEGMGSGASLAGMSFEKALPIQIAIAIQNIPEGLILALCLMDFGWSKRNAILGSVFSGVVEFSGAAVAGLALQKSMALLPFLLSLAGGAMLMSVALELYQSGKQGRLIQKPQLLLGLLMIPFMNLFLS